MKEPRFYKLIWTGYCIIYDGKPIPDGGLLIDDEDKDMGEWRVSYFIKRGPRKKPCTIIRRYPAIAKVKSVTDGALADFYAGYRIDEYYRAQAWIITPNLPEPIEILIEDRLIAKKRMLQFRLHSIYDEDALREFVQWLYKVDETQGLYDWLFKKEVRHEQA